MSHDENICKHCQFKLNMVDGLYNTIDAAIEVGVIDPADALDVVQSLLSCFLSDYFKAEGYDKVAKEFVKNAVEEARATDAMNSTPTGTGH